MQWHAPWRGCCRLMPGQHIDSVSQATVLWYQEASAAMHGRAGMRGQGVAANTHLEECFQAWAAAMLVRRVIANQRRHGCIAVAIELVAVMPGVFICLQAAN